MNYENENVYSPELAPKAEPVAVIGRCGPSVVFGIGVYINGVWDVQWYEPPAQHGFKPLSYYIENMGEPKVVGFTPLMPPFGFKAKEAA